MLTKNPFRVKEKGYAGFEIFVDVYFKGLSESDSAKKVSWLMERTFCKNDLLESTFIWNFRWPFSTTCSWRQPSLSWATIRIVRTQSAILAMSNWSDWRSTTPVEVLSKASNLVSREAHSRSPVLLHHIDRHRKNPPVDITVPALKANRWVLNIVISRFDLHGLHYFAPGSKV